MMKHIILILTLFYFHSLQAIEIVGYPKVVDGDTIHIKNFKIRLEGIDAPEIKQKCKKNLLTNIYFKFTERLLLWTSI